MKRLFALFLCTLICLILFPVSAFADDYTVTFHTGGFGTVAPWTVFEDDEVRTVNKPVNPMGNVKCLDYWMKDGEVYDFNSEVTSSFELVAHWREEGHDYQVTGTIKPVTCEQNGEQTVTCTLCGATDTQTIPSAGHQWDTGTVTTPATCIADGIKTFHCTVEGCNATKTESITKLEEHCWDNGTVTTPATCVTDGIKTFHCTVEGCNATKTESITKLEEHSWDDGTVTTPATCAANGVKTFHCTEEECDATKTESITKLEEHSWDNGTITTPATCAADGVKTFHCTVEGCTATKNIEISRTDNHTWNLQGVCEQCGAAGYSVTFILEGPGSAEVNDIPVKDGDTVTFTVGTEITVRFIPDPATAHAHLANATLDSEPVVIINNTLPVPADSAGSCTVVGVFKTRAEGIARQDNIPQEDQTAAQKQQGLLAQMYELAQEEVLFSVYNVTPCWDGDQNDPLSEDELEAELRETGSITFFLEYPSDKEYNKSDYEWKVYHMNGTNNPDEIKSIEPDDDGVWISYNRFSTFALYGIPEKIDFVTLSESTAVIVAHQDTENKTPPRPPEIRARRIINNGNIQTGAILDVDSTMEYRRKDSSEDYKPISGNTQEVKEAGTYCVRYQSRFGIPASENTEVVIEEWYTVSVKLLYGKGTYEVTSKTKHYKDKEDVYLVKKGDSISFKFTPDSHYWLYVINIDDVYVGQKNVKTNFTIENIKKKTLVTYGFSDSSSSPKTGDDSKTVLWIAEELISLTAMIAITGYLFRRRETW